MYFYVCSYVCRGMLNHEEEKLGGALPNIEKLHVYKTRWLMLGIFVLYSASNAMQWIQYSIISNVIVKYYGISTTWVDWTSMIYMILYIPFIFPASYILDKLVSIRPRPWLRLPFLVYLMIAKSINSDDINWLDAWCISDVISHYCLWFR